MKIAFTIFTVLATVANNYENCQKERDSSQYTSYSVHNWQNRPE